MNEFRGRFVTLWLIPLTIVVLFSCTGCAHLVAKAPQVGPDAALLQPCPDPEGSAETNGTLAAWLLAYRKALRSCNDQITTFKEAAHAPTQQPAEPR